MMNRYADCPTESFKDLCELCTEILKGETYNVSDSYTVYKSPGSFWYNRNFINTDNNNKITSSIKSIKERIHTGLPFLISYTKFEENKYIDTLFSNEGYNLLVDQVGMNFDLKNEISKDVDSNIVLIGSHKIEEWSDVVSTAFGKPPESAPFIAMSGSGKCNIYAYMDNDKIVGTSLLYTKNGNAGIHEVSVLEEYRGKGIGKKLINRILQDAKREGSKIASLQASALGEPLYRSIGFEKVSLVATYILPPPK